MPDTSNSTICLAAQHDLAQLVSRHVFLLAPNKSGSSYVQRAMARSRRTWNLTMEGQHALGFAGPEPAAAGLSHIWGSSPDWVTDYRAPDAHDWRKTRQAWYFQAVSRAPDAPVFATKSPPFLLVAEQLAAAFAKARFLVMLRDPYATAAGVLRERERIGDVAGDELRRLVGQHLVTCFEAQRRNVEALGDQAALFRYEDLCADPAMIEQRIKLLVPELDDLDLRHGQVLRANEVRELRNMNAEAFARLTPDDITMLNREFAPHEALFAYFGYALL